MVKERWTYTPDFKARVVLELLSGKKSTSQASREYGIKDSVLSRWRLCCPQAGSYRVGDALIARLISRPWQDLRRRHAIYTAR